MRKYNQKDAYYIILLLVIAVIAFWQVAFMKNCLKWDMLDAYYPWRYFAGECFHNKVLPSWNPFQQCGFPAHADLMSFWYPEETVMGSLFGYSFYTLHFLFVLYIFLAGIGMYYLSKHLHFKKPVAFLAGAAFMLSGFFIGNAQHFNYIIGGAWLPFILLFYLKMTEQRTLVNPIILSLFFYLLISGGYPAIVIIAAYVLGALFFYFFAGFIIQKDYKTLRQFVLNNFIFIAIALFLSSGIIVSLIQVKPFIARFSELGYDMRNVNSFSPKCLISLIAPFTVTKDQVVFGNDVSMANIYFGIVFLIFFITGLVRKSKGLMVLFLIIGIFSLLAAMGDNIPVLSRFIFKYLPFMDKFRHQSVFRLFAILFFIMFAGRQLSELYRNNHKLLSILKTIAIIFFAGIVSGSIFLLIRKEFHHFSFFHVFKEGWVKVFMNSTFQERLLLHLFIQLIITGCLIFFLIKKKWLMTALPFLIVVDLLISVQLNIHSTVIAEYNPVEMQGFINKSPKGFPLPYPGAIGDNIDKKFASVPLYRNTNIYHKTISFDSFNPFLFEGYKKLDFYYPQLKDSILNNNLLYLSDSILSFGRIDSASTFTKDVLYIDDSVYRQWKSGNLKKSVKDSVVMTGFAPNRFEFITNTENNTIITLLQSNFTGWKLLIDGIPQPIHTSNLLFCSALLPGGQHHVVFLYKNKWVNFLFIVTNLLFLFLALGVLIHIIRNTPGLSRKTRALGYAIPILFIIAMGMVYACRPTQKQKEDKTGRKLAASFDQWSAELGRDSIAVINYSKIQMDSSLGTLNDLNFSSEISSDTGYLPVLGYIDTIQSPFLLFLSFNMLHSDEVFEILKSKYPYIVVEKQVKQGRLLLLRREKSENRFESSNNYDITPRFWNVKPAEVSNNPEYGRLEKLDSTNIYSSTFENIIKETGQGGECLINASLSFYPVELSGALIVIDVQSDTSDPKWFGFKIGSENPVNISGWHKTNIVKRLNLKAEDRIKIYAWNKGKGTVLIDNFDIAIISLNKP